jgi:ABC-type transport system involved in cytochrome bd biosynthesis fused ATPase/permease subunit
MAADRIYVLEAGGVRECGTHGELVRQAGLYARLYQGQFKSEERSDESAAPSSDRAPAIAGA